MRRLFVLIHHKEVALAVDTAKLLAMAYPSCCRLVLGALPSAERDAMRGAYERCLRRRAGALSIVALGPRGSRSFLPDTTSMSSFSSHVFLVPSKTSSSRVFV